MPVSNIALIFVVSVVAVALMVYLLRKNKSEIVEDKVDVDDKTYTLDVMIKFVKKRLDEIDVNKMTPLEALNLVYELKEMA